MPSTCAVSCQVNDQNNLPVQGAVISATLSAVEVYQGYVTPDTVESTTDVNGQAVLHLWPNQLGAVSSYYKIRIVTPLGKTLRTTAVVPDAPTAQLHLISELPPFEGKTQSRVLLDSVVNAGVALEAKTKAATTALEVSIAAAQAAATALANSVTNSNIPTDKHYAHIQSVASASWGITHNLNKYPSVTITDSAGDQVEGEVHHDGLNALTVKFSAPFAGNAYLN